MTSIKYSVLLSLVDKNFYLSNNIVISFIVWDRKIVDVFSL